MKYIGIFSSFLFIFSFLSCEPIPGGEENSDNYYLHELSVKAEDGTVLFSSKIDESLFSDYYSEIDASDILKSAADPDLSEKSDIGCVRVTISEAETYYVPFSFANLKGGGAEKTVADICLLSEDVSFTAADEYGFKVKAYLSSDGESSRTFQIVREPASFMIALVVKEGSTNIHYYYATHSSSLPPFAEMQSASLIYNGSESTGFFAVWDRSSAAP